MGHADLALTAVRISGGWATVEEDWKRCGDIWLQAHARLAERRRSVA
jgi:cysteine desulfurase